MVPTEASLWRFPKDDEWTEQDDAGDSMFAIIQPVISKPAIFFVK